MIHHPVKYTVLLSFLGIASHCLSQQNERLLLGTWIRNGQSSLGRVIFTKQPSKDYDTLTVTYKKDQSVIYHHTAPGIKPKLITGAWKLSGDTLIQKYTNFISANNEVTFIHILTKDSLVIASQSLDHYLTEEEEEREAASLRKSSAEFTNPGEGPQFTKVPSPASYRGGEVAFQKFIKDNLNIPKYALPKIPTTIMVSFVINRDGWVDYKSIQVLRKLNPIVDKEVLRLLSIMPQWYPGSREGRYVSKKIWKSMTIYPG